ncbi:MAG: alpha/beta hydrolase [Anaerovorax sp.]|nr:alpha/beta hydrolase [Anaerovorax sp.]
MIKENILIDNIPAILWGEKSSMLFVAVHGNMSSKSDVPIAILAEETIPLGYQVLSFDLPKHGDRKEEPTLCKAQNCIADLEKVMRFAKMQTNSISIFANSMGAYFSLVAYKNERLKQSLFLSPIVDMERIITNMMKWLNITQERLEKEQEISTSFGHTLYWDYYQYVKQNPITKWANPTSILFGKKDNLCEYDVVQSFVTAFNCNLEIAKNAEHYFHTDDDLKTYRSWIKKQIIK